jgi:hypothetical protein
VFRSPTEAIRKPTLGKNRPNPAARLKFIPLPSKLDTPLQAF